MNKKEKGGCLYMLFAFIDAIGGFLKFVLGAIVVFIGIVLIMFGVKSRDNSKKRKNGPTRSGPNKTRINPPIDDSPQKNPPEKPAQQDELIEKLRVAKQKELTATAYSRVYDKKFAEIGEALQRLMGIAFSVQNDTSRLQEFLHDAINDMKTALGYGYRMQEPAVETVNTAFLDEACQKGEAKIREIIDECNANYEIAKISFSYKNIIDALSGIMPRLETAGLEQVKDLADNLRQTMIANGIFPLDRADAGTDAMSGWFVEKSPGSLKYPALFVKRNNTYKLLGSSYRGSV